MQPVEDAVRLDERRGTMGLPAIAEYKRMPAHMYHRRVEWAPGFAGAPHQGNPGMKTTAIGLAVSLLVSSGLCRAADDVLACSRMQYAYAVHDYALCARIADDLMHESRWPGIYADTAAHCQALTGEVDKALASLDLAVAGDDFIAMDGYLQSDAFKALRAAPEWNALQHKIADRPRDDEITGAGVDVRYMKAHPPAWPQGVPPDSGPYLVVVLPTIAPDGSVVCLQVEKSSGNERIDAAALAAAFHWRYQPASVRGVPTHSKVRIPVRFNPASP